MSQPKGYVDSGYLQSVADLLKQTKERSYLLMRIQPGHQVLDVGCGPGSDTIPMAHLVGSTGKVIGVDYDAAMIAEADQKAESAGVRAWVSHKRADATSLPFELGEFDSCRSDRLFQHLLNPAKALYEMTRVTKSGGWIVVFDADWGTRSVDTPEVDIERRLVRVHAERCTNNGYSGRQLFRLFKQQKLLDISIEMISVPFTDYGMARDLARLDKDEHEALAAGIITNEELERWRSNLAKADEDGVFFCSVSGVLAAGRKA